MVLLRDKNVGDVVMIRENGVGVRYIIVQKGKPSSMYDDSCDGVWLLRETVHSQRAIHVTSSGGNANDYENSEINAWLKSTFLPTIDEQIRKVMKTVKIPFKKGFGSTTSTGIYSGANGLSCKAFLLSANEAGRYSKGDGQSELSDDAKKNPETAPVDGTILQYFKTNTSCVCYDSTGAGSSWWTRSPSLKSKENVWNIWYDAAGGYSYPCNSHYKNGIRPAFVLAYNHPVDANGYVIANMLPVITSSKTGDLGTLTSGFSCDYSVNDEDADDSLTVSVKVDNTLIRQFSAVKGKQENYTLGGEEWLKIANGAHTFSIAATDGKDTVTSTATFRRNQTSLSIELETPLRADARIKACALTIEGSIPADAVCRFEVTNNPLDASPVWEDCTVRIRAGLNYVFKNTAVKNGNAFSFRMNISRGVSGLGGYVSRILGGFE